MTLNILNNLKALNTDRPKDSDLNADHMTSNMEPEITTQSNRLNDDSKYCLGPKAYNFIIISDMNRPRNINSA